MTRLCKALPLILVLLAAFTALPLAAQATDCSFTLNFTGDAVKAVPNLSQNTPCVNWRVTFSTAAGMTVTAVTFQTSPDNSTWTTVPNTPCSSTVQPPCIIQGTNPLTGTTQGMSYFAAYGAYVQVVVSGTNATGTGTVRAYGAKGATASAPPGSGTTGGGVFGLTAGAIPIATSPTTLGNSQFTDNGTTVTLGGGRNLAVGTPTAGIPAPLSFRPLWGANPVLTSATAEFKDPVAVAGTSALYAFYSYGTSTPRVWVTNYATSGSLTTIDFENQGNAIPLGGAGTYDQCGAFSPSAPVLVSGTYYMFYTAVTDRPANNCSGGLQNNQIPWNIALATSSSLAGPWTKAGSLIIDGTIAGQTLDPWIVPASTSSDALFQMYVSQAVGACAGGGTCRKVVLYESSLITGPWVRIGVVYDPVIWQANGNWSPGADVENPAVIKYGSLWVLTVDNAATFASHSATSLNPATYAFAESSQPILSSPGITSGVLGDRGSSDALGPFYIGSELFAVYQQNGGGFGDQLSIGQLGTNQQADPYLGSVRVQPSGTANVNSSIWAGSLRTIPAPTGNQNSGFGFRALPVVTTGNANAASGWESCFAVTTGGANTCSGALSISTVTSGNYNTGIGYQAGATTNGVTSGSNNTFLGASTGQSTSTQQTYMTVIGSGVAGACSSCVVIGRSTDVTIMRPPTSCTGLATGTLWNNLGLLAICP